MYRVRALFDYEGDPAQNDLSFFEGDEITVTNNANEDNGWLEGVNALGQGGQFPANYVEKIEGTDIARRRETVVRPQSVYSESINDFNDDWDDDSDINDDETGVSSTSSTIDQSSRTISKKTGLTLFNSFAKLGGESYLLNELNVSVPDDKRIAIYNVDNRFSWESSNRHYTVAITSTKKEAKLKGLKSYISYQLTPSFNNIKVSRRYKHFDWLYERMSYKFHLLSLPPLPDKVLSGRYEGQFIEHRKAQLQEFVDYCCRHPVISDSDLWLHFLTCTDQKLWKKGKRSAEKDQIIGAAFCLYVKSPDNAVFDSTERMIENEKVPYVNTLENSLKLLQNTCNDTSKKYKLLYSKEYQKVGENFCALGFAVSQRNKAIPCHLSHIINSIGKAYMEIGKSYSTQPQHDWYPLYDKIYLYRGVVSSFGTVANVNREAQNKKREYARIHQGDKLQDITSRANVFTYVTLAELTHIENEQDGQLMNALRKHVEEQIKFYENIVGTLKNVLPMFDKK